MTATFVSVLTPPGRGAVAVIAVEGPDALRFVSQFFQPASQRPLAHRKIGAIVYGRWSDASDGTAAGMVGEDVIVCRRNETSIEVHCHGGVAASERIVGDLTEVGATAEKWTTWVERHEASRIRAAARIALAHCKTQKTATLLLDQYNGALQRELQRIVDQLQQVQSTPTAGAGKIGDDCRHAIVQLLARAAIGLHLTEPWQVVIAGPPNVGKSSLINAILGYQRAIVFDQPGTTRDVVTALTALDGWPIEFSDTAGLREHRSARVGRHGARPAAGPARRSVAPAVRCDPALVHRVPAARRRLARSDYCSQQMRSASSQHTWQTAGPRNQRDHWRWHRRTHCGNRCPANRGRTGARRSNSLHRRASRTTARGSAIAAHGRHRCRYARPAGYACTYVGRSRRAGTATRASERLG